MSGLIHIYAGDGKGKTTAAVGLAVRCAGSGGRVVFCQFLKDNASGELAILRQIPAITLVQGEPVPGFYKNLRPEQREALQASCAALLEQAFQTAREQNARLLVLDEAVAAYNHGLLAPQRLLELLQNKPAELEVALTGRSPAPELIALADYVSEVKKIKHPFDSGLPARRGIEK